MYCPIIHLQKLINIRKIKIQETHNLTIKTLIEKWDVDVSKSFMIGDNKKDMMAAKKYYTLNMLIKIYLTLKKLIIILKFTSEYLKILISSDIPLSNENFALKPVNFLITNKIISFIWIRFIFDISNF